MRKIEKTVFISYRRTNVFTASAIFDNLTHHGYDVFFDYESINAGDFEQIILRSIESRAHFLLILTPSTLEHCKEPNDMVRREIEHAVKHKRNIILLKFDKFDFGDIEKHLPDYLHHLKKYNALEVFHSYFDEAMTRLRERFLNVPVDTILHPVPPTVERYEDKQQASASATPQVTGKQLTAEEYNERGNKHFDLGNYDFAIADYSEAIRLNPDNGIYYNNRGNAYDSKSDYDAAIRDYDAAIRLNPAHANAYNNRGAMYDNKGDYEAAIRELNTAIRLNPDYANAYNNRGAAYSGKGDHDEALRDLNTAIRLNPDHAMAYNNRGFAYHMKGEYDAAIRDYERCLQLDPNHRLAKGNLEAARKAKNGG